MKRVFVAMFLVLIMSSWALAVESPHTPTLGCTGCHIPDNSGNSYSYDMTNTTGLNNLCVNCHKPDTMVKAFSNQDIANPFGSTDLGAPAGVQKQTSHNWAAPANAPAAGAALPLNGAIPLLNASKKGIISCASCHGNHLLSGGNLMRSPNDSDQLCFECHSVRVQRNVQTGTHPINFNYTSATSKVKLKPSDYQPLPVNANPANPTSAMKLTNGKLICSTCHGIHFTDSNSATVDGAAASSLGQLSTSQGYLLRTDMRGRQANAINICTNCHASKSAHNRNGQNIQCADCHAAHVDPGDGTDPNVWLVRRYMNYSSGVKLNSYRRKVLNQKLDAQSNFAGEFGVCRACHEIPAPSAGYPSEHASTDSNVCRSCHTHNASAGSFSADCKGCHGFPPQQNIAGGPQGYAKNSQYDYKTSGVFKDESLSGHLPHAGSAPYTFGCNECHAGNNHATGNFQQVFKQSAGSLAATGGTTPLYNANGTCSATYCHSNGAPKGGVTVFKTPAWANAKGSIIGTANECNACHDASPATNAHSGHLSFGFACVLCHSATVDINNKTNISKHVNGLKDVMFSGTAAAGGTSSYNSNTSSCTTLYCHSNGNQNNLVYVNPPAWTSGAKFGCNGCHGITSPLGAPDYANGGPGATSANSHGGHTAGYADTTVCSNCHFTTVSSTAGNTLATASKHLSGSVDVVFNPAVAGPNAKYNPSTKTCENVACHGNSLAQWGSKGGCLGCHSASINNRAAITSQFSGNSHHVQGVDPSGEHCYQCHWEANSDGSINRNYHRSSVSGSPVELVIYGAGARPSMYVAGTTAVQYTANGSRTEMAKINAVCIGCHNDANKTIQPFGDGKTPAAYAWDANSIAAKFSDTGTTPWGKYTGTNVTPKNNVTKAFSAHGNAVNNKGGWNTSETWTDRMATSNVLCFDCHNSHGSSVTGTTTSYTSATTNGGILKDTVAGKGGYAMSYKPAAGGSVAEHNSYNPGAGICFDCHMKDTAGITPWGYKGTYGSTQQIMGYNDSAYFGNNTFGYALRYAYKGTLTNQGGHFGASSTLSSVPAHQVGGLCTPCHDPHGVSPTMGSNKQYGVPLLKGTWLTSPYKEDVATADNKAYIGMGSPGREDAPRPTSSDIAAYQAAITTSFHIDQNTFTSGNITQTADQFAGLCLGCHAKSTLTNGTNHTWKSKDRIHESVKGWKTANGTIKHNYSCSKCHAPHNANLPRLMISNCLDSNHRGRVANNTSPVLSGSKSGSEGRGSGHFPGIYSGRGSEGGSSSSITECHDNNDAKQQWNSRTPWTNSGTTPPPGGGGTTPPGDTTPPAGSAPTVPVLIPEPNLVCYRSCSTTLQWAASLNGNPGASTQYQVQVSRSSSFSSVQYSSGWISTTSYTPSVSTGYTYYWRVQARDKTKTSLVSAWSDVGSYNVSTR
ncbi:MAG: CxxxxCH/CxxCH domain-containing protein [Geobacter sp.]|nr:CxxxxCH/CxxCH domain-containing protein [Geobacter sp.]